MFFVLNGSKGKAKTIEISTSKIKNKIAIKKNWKENGTPEGLKTEKPHSNSDHFSLFMIIFFCIACTIIHNNEVINIVVNNITEIFIFVFSF